MELETVKEHRILRADKLRADEVPISPRRFQQIKANCIRRRRTPKGSGGSLQDRLRRKIALRRASSEPLLDAAPLLETEELSRFLAARESSRARAARSLPGGGGSAPASRPSSAVDFVTRNRRSATDFQWQHRVQLEMQNLRRCARTDLAKKKRQMQLEEMHRAAAEDYRRLGNPRREFKALTWNRFFRGDGSTSAGRGLRLHGAEEAEDEARVQLALENLAKYMPSKVMKLFTRLFDQESSSFDQETLFQIFSGEVADNMAMACRLYALVRRLISWSRTWKKKKAAEVLQGFMSIPPPLGFRVKLPIQRYVRRLKALQRTWRRFQWRLRSLTKHVYEQMWFKQENELLEDIFMFCPGDHATIVHSQSKTKKEGLPMGAFPWAKSKTRHRRLPSQHVRWWLPPTVRLLWRPEEITEFLFGDEITEEQRRKAMDLASHEDLNRGENGFSFVPGAGAATGVSNHTSDDEDLAEARRHLVNLPKELIAEYHEMQKLLLYA
eukprot:g17920.t1